MKSVSNRYVAFSFLFFVLMVGIQVQARVKGYVDRVHTDQNHVYVSGWTCDSGVNSSIGAHLYVGGAAGQGGVFVKAITANVANEVAVNRACGTSSSKHRFQFQLPKATMAAHSQKTIYVHGTSASGGTNFYITRSGAFRVPSVTATVNLSQLPRESNGDVRIPAGVTALIDGSLTRGVLHVMGNLECPVNGRHVLNIQGVMVMNGGRVICGRPDRRIQGKIIFNIRRGKVQRMTLPDGRVHVMGERVFSVMNGGRVEMFGGISGARWARLNGTVNQGARRIKLNRDVLWKEGDSIAIAPTDFNWREAEERIIEERISSREFVLNRVLEHTHFGQNRNYSANGNNWLLKSSAEVGNLTRNIVIQTADVQQSPETARFLGAHMMVMRGGFAQIDAVEFFRMGQAGKMARYPFHWHLAKDVSGQFIKNSSIHESFQRCITVHGTHKATVHNNVCYSHHGHGIFLEDGNEVNNRITSNLLIKSMTAIPGRALLESDHLRPNGTSSQFRRFVPPAAYWVSHPTNYVVGNVSVGSQGTGFWMSFEQYRLCDKIDGSDCTTPARGETLRFDHNLAKGNAVGFTWDGARSDTAVANENNSDDKLLSSSEYQPPSIPTFRSNQAIKGRQSCFYTRSTTMNFDGTVTADCSWHHFHAFNIRVSNSMLIGNSPIPDTSYSKKMVASGVAQGHYGFVLYDGPFELNKVHFQDFSSTDEHHANFDGHVRRIASIPFGRIGGANKYTNRSRNLSFSPEPWKRLYFGGTHLWEDAHVSQSLLDIDGSLTGEEDTLVTVKNRFNKTRDCFDRNDWGGYCL